MALIHAALTVLRSWGTEKKQQAHPVVEKPIMFMTQVEREREREKREERERERDAHLEEKNTMER